MLEDDLLEDDLVENETSDESIAALQSITDFTDWNEIAVLWEATKDKRLELMRNCKLDRIKSYTKAYPCLSIQLGVELVR